MALLGIGLVACGTARLDAPGHAAQALGCGNAPCRGDTDCCDGYSCIGNGICAATAECAFLFCRDDGDCCDGFGCGANGQCSAAEAAEADAIRGSLAITIGDIRTTLTIQPVDEAEEDGPGVNDRPLAARQIDLLGLSVASLTGIDDYTEVTASAHADGRVTIGQISLLAGQITASGLVTDSRCDEPAAGVSCAASMTVTELRVAGSLVTAGTIAPNTSIPVHIVVPVPALGATIPVALACTLVLNEQLVATAGARDEVLIVNGLHLHSCATVPPFFGVALEAELIVAGPGVAIPGCFADCGNQLCGSFTDIQCMCTNGDVQNCIVSSCAGADLAQAAQLQQQFCH